MLGFFAHDQPSAMQARARTPNAAQHDVHASLVNLSHWLTETVANYADTLATKWFKPGLPLTQTTDALRDPHQQLQAMHGNVLTTAARVARVPGVMLDGSAAFRLGALDQAFGCVSPAGASMTHEGPGGVGLSASVDRAMIGGSAYAPSLAGMSTFSVATTGGMVVGGISNLATSGLFSAGSLVVGLPVGALGVGLTLGYLPTWTAGVLGGVLAMADRDWATNILQFSPDSVQIGVRSQSMTLGQLSGGGGAFGVGMVKRVVADTNTQQVWTTSVSPADAVRALAASTLLQRKARGLGLVTAEQQIPAIDNAQALKPGERLMLVQRTTVADAWAAGVVAMHAGRHTIGSSGVCIALDGAAVGSQTLHGSVMTQKLTATSDSLDLPIAALWLDSTIDTHVCSLAFETDPTHSALGALSRDRGWGADALTALLGAPIEILAPALVEANNGAEAAYRAFMGLPSPQGMALTEWIARQELGIRSQRGMLLPLVSTLLQSPHLACGFERQSGKTIHQTMASAAGSSVLHGTEWLAQDDLFNRGMQQLSRAYLNLSTYCAQSLSEQQACSMIQFRRIIDFAGVQALQGHYEWLAPYLPQSVAAGGNPVYAHDQRFRLETSISFSLTATEKRDLARRGLFGPLSVFGQIASKLGANDALDRETDRMLQRYLEAQPQRLIDVAVALKRPAAIEISTTTNLVDQLATDAAQIALLSSVEPSPRRRFWGLGATRTPPRLRRTLQRVRTAQVLLDGHPVFAIGVKDLKAQRERLAELAVTLEDIASKYGLVG